MKLSKNKEKRMSQYDTNKIKNGIIDIIAIEKHIYIRY